MAGDGWYDAWLREKLRGSRGSPACHERSRSRSGRRHGGHAGGSHRDGGPPTRSHPAGARDVPSATRSHPAGAPAPVLRGNLDSMRSPRRSRSHSQPLRLQPAPGVGEPLTLREAPSRDGRDTHGDGQTRTAARGPRLRSTSRPPPDYDSRSRHDHRSRHGDRHRSRGDSRGASHRRQHHDRDSHRERADRERERERAECERAERDRAERDRAERDRVEREERARRKEREERVARCKRKLADAVKDKRTSAALEAALDLIELGEKPLPRDLLCGMLHNAAARPGAEHFVKTVQCCILGEIQIDPQSFAKLLGLLLSRDASHAQVRAVLNMALPRGAKPIPLVPDDLSIEEALAAFQDAEVYRDHGEVPDEVAEGDAAASADWLPVESVDTAVSPERVTNIPPVLIFKNCEVHEELNGEYHAHDAIPEVLNHNRPIYIAEQGADREMYVYYWEEHPSRPWLTGWWVGTDVGGDEVFAYNAGADWTPPKERWQVIVDGQRRPDPAKFCEPGDTKDPAAPALSMEEELPLMKLNLQSLQGLVGGSSSSSSSAGTSRELREPMASSQKAVAYFAHFMVLMNLEHLHEIGIFRRRLQRYAIERLVRMGWALDGIECMATYGRRESRRGLLPGWPDRGAQFVAFRTPVHADLDRMRFRKGDSLIVSKSDPLKDRIAEGTCVDMDHRKTVVQLFGEMPDDATRVRWRLDAFVNRTVYERQVAALLQLATSKDLLPVCELLVAGNVGQLDAWAQLAVLPPWRRPREGQPVSKNSRAAAESRSVALAKENADGIDKAKGAEACCEARAIKDLNSSQKMALEAALTRRCTVVQGPPGTGKTHVSVKILQLWTQTMGLSPVLATSDSNVAVDNIAEGLHRAGVKVVRVGRVEKVRGHLEELTLEAMVERQREEQRVEAEAKAAAEEEAAAAATEDPDIEDWGNTYDVDDEEEAAGANEPPEPASKRPLTAEQELWADQAEKRKQRKEDYEERMKILQNMQVICTTTMSAGSDFLSRFQFHGILIDEVAQATETSSIVPIVLRGAKQLVLVGDSCQLPPSVLSREAELRGLSLSVYSRLVDAGLQPHFLDTQYRSHPKIAEFSARCFYNGNLRSGVPGSARPPPRGVRWPSPRVPVAFFEVGEDEVIDGESKSNPGEAKRLSVMLLDILAEGELRLNDIGIVTPYGAQVRLLRRIIREAVPGVESRKLLEIASVDNFQGREKELIIFSAVRCNARGNVGFLADWRRLNVMLTRARRGLVVFGAAKTLRHDAHWSQWLQWCYEHGATADAPSLAAPHRAPWQHTLRPTKSLAPRLVNRIPAPKLAPKVETRFPVEAKAWSRSHVATPTKAPGGSPIGVLTTGPKPSSSSLQVGGRPQPKAGRVPAKSKFVMAPKVSYVAPKPKDRQQAHPKGSIGRVWETRNVGRVAAGAKATIRPPPWSRQPHASVWSES